MSNSTKKIWTDFESLAAVSTAGFAFHHAPELSPSAAFPAGSSHAMSAPALPARRMSVHAPAL